jgi:hypothetical protein
MRSHGLLCGCISHRAVLGCSLTTTSLRQEPKSFDVRVDWISKSEEQVCEMASQSLKSHKRLLERSVEAPAQRKRVATDSITLPKDANPSTSFSVHALLKDARDLHIPDLRCILSCAACIPPSAAHSDCHYHGPRLQGESAWRESSMLQTSSKSGSNRGTVQSLQKARQKVLIGRLLTCRVGSGPSTQPDFGSGHATSDFARRFLEGHRVVANDPEELELQDSGSRMPSMEDLNLAYYESQYLGIGGQFD